MGSSKEQVQEIVSSNGSSKVRFSETEQKALEAIKTYLDGREQFLSPKADGSDSTQPTDLAEDLLLSLKLQAERLKKLDISMEIRDEWLIPMKIGRSLFERPEFTYDGGRLVGRLRKRMKVITSYVKKPRVTMNTFQESLQKDYYIRETEDGNFQISSENLILQTEEYDRSCDYWDDRRWRWEKLGVGFYLFCMSCFWLVHLVSFLVFVLSIVKGFGGSEAAIVSFSLWFVSMGGAVPLGFHCWRMVPSYRHRRASARVVQSIHSSIPEFCINDFVSMAENRINSIFYANRSEQVAHFVNGDLHAFQLRHAYVVNCETMNFWFEDFWQDSNNQYIEVTEKVRLTSKEQGYRVKRGILYIGLRFVRPLNVIMMGDWYIEKTEVIKWQMK